MEKRQNKNIWDKVRIYLYVLCGTFGCIFSICDALHFSYDFGKKTAGTAGLIIAVVLAAVMTFQQKGKRKSGPLILWAGSAAVMLWFGKPIVNEAEEIVNQLSILIKQYYNAEVGEWVMQSYLGEDISAGLIIPALAAAVFFAGIFGKEKCRSAGCFGLGFLFLMPFLVGSVLRWETLLLLGICGVGLRNGTGNGVWKRDVAAVLVFAAAFGIGHLFIEKPVRIYSENPGSLREDMNQFLKNAGTTGKAAGGVGAGNVGIYDELVPGDEVQLILRADETPSADLYLKGYIAGKYGAQKWSGMGTRGLESQTGKTVEEIEGSPYEKLLAEASGCQKIEIEEVGANPSYDYYPYYSSYDGAACAGDGYVKGRRKKKYEIEYCNLWSLPDASEERWEADYSEFVQKNYLDVPEHVREELKDAAAQTRGESLNEVLSNIRDYLDFETKYTLSPGRTPMGRDTVLYFLNENKKGYCVHYASAAAVLLRMQGIPSRFVSGYVVGQNEFQKDDRGVTAKVTGKNAHAWAEYYVRGFGWIPFEATPPYRGGVYDADGLNELTGTTALDDAKENNTQTEKEPDTQAGDNQEENMPDENADNDDKPNEEANDANANENMHGNTAGGPNETKDDQAEKNTGSGGVGIGEADRPGGIGGAVGPGRIEVRAKIERMAVCILCVTGSLIFVLSAFFVRRNMRMQKKYGTVKNRNVRVQQIFYYFYEMIVYLGFPKEKTPQSAGFVEEFCRQFTSVSESEAALFMEIIEKANYGGMEICIEEERFIEKIYRKVRQDGMGKISRKKKIWMKIWKFY